VQGAGQRRSLAAGRTQQQAFEVVAGGRGTGRDRAQRLDGRRQPGRVDQVATAAGVPVTLANRAAGGNPSSDRSASSRSANQPGSHRTSACTTASPPSAPTTTRPPSAADRTSAAAFIQRRSVSSAARKSGRVSSAQPSSSSAAPYPPSATGSAPGVATISAAVAGTVASTPSRFPFSGLVTAAPEWRTGMPGNARPNSSAVRALPTTTARSVWLPQLSQDHRPPGRPHQRQAGIACPEVAASGPWQWPQRAGVRQRAQASTGR
jgi:hypothetical protein